MIFEGLWEGFKWPEGTVLRTFTIVTTNANLIMAELHDRMSAILEPRICRRGWARSGDPVCGRSGRQQTVEQSEEQWGGGVVAVTSFRLTVRGKACRRQDNIVSPHGRVPGAAMRQITRNHGFHGGREQHWSPHLDRARGKGRVRRA